MRLTQVSAMPHLLVGIEKWGKVVKAAGLKAE